MQQPTSERTVQLSDSSWELLDAAAEMDGTWSPDDFLNSLVQGYLGFADMHFRPVQRG